MSMTPAQAFKLAFLQDCANRGLTMEQIREAVKAAVVKTAGLTDLVTRPYNAAFDALGNLGSTAKFVGGLGLIAGPPVLGAAAGYGAAKLTDWDDMDTEEAKKRELIDMYRRYSLQAKQNAAAKQRRLAREPSFSRI